MLDSRMLEKGRKYFTCNVALCVGLRGVMFVAHIDVALRWIFLLTLVVSFRVVPGPSPFLRFRRRILVLH